MSVILIGPNRPMAIGPSGVALWQPLSTATVRNSSNTPLSLIPGLRGWWDAATPAGCIGTAGTVQSGWNQPVGTVLDQSTAQHNLTPYSYVAPTVTPVGAPRLSGFFGGVGRLSAISNALTPPLDPDLGFQVPASVLDWSGNWTWYFVWSRPNWRQGSGRDANPITLISAGTTPVLQADSLGGANRLVLFPGVGQTVLTQTLTRRHTHSIVLRAQLDGTVSAWLDGILVANAITRPQLVANGAPILFLHDGSLLGGAQCWFHEAACWQKALTSTELGQLESHASRWHRGVRQCVLLLVDGQSNAINYSLNDGAATLLAQGIAWYTGALAYGVIATTGNPNSYTMQSGHGLYAVSNGNYPGSFLQNPSNSSPPPTWLLGTDGQAVQQAISAMTSDDVADVRAIVWPWNETDSLRGFSELTTFTAAAQRFLGLERGMVNKGADALPLIWWNAIPYGTNGGIQMHRSAVAGLAADATQNIVIGNPQTTDSNPRGSSWDPTTGIATGGDSAHRDSLDNQRFARLAAPVVARALITAGIADSVTAIPAGLPRVGGPRIVHAFRQSNSMVVLTIQHDAGNDIKVPLRAGSGIGFAVMDGGSQAAPGTIVSATACSRIDTTHLLLTLATSLTNPSSACGVYYPYGVTTIGRGNAVTDNYSNVTPLADWDIAADLGTAWRLDFPLAATFTAVPLSDTAG